MDEETQKIIAEQMKQLPKDVVEAIISVDYKTKLQEITKRQRLLIDQAAKMEMETTLVMIGLEPLSDYTENLQRELAIPIIRAKELAMDVSENIFKPIRESLKTMNEAVDETENKQQGQTYINPSVNQEETLNKFTNSNEFNLNRDQILNEIENPSIINNVSRKTQTTPAVNIPEVTPPAPQTEVEIRPTQEIEIIPGQKVRDVSGETVNTGMKILESKMTSTTVVTPQVVEVKTETKLPEVKNRPSSGVDPYREAIM